MLTNNRRYWRVQLQHPIAVDVGEGAPLREGMMLDVCQDGARLRLDHPEDLPPRFTLLLTERGFPRRTCKISWRSSDEVGVSFVFDTPRRSQCA